MTAVDEPDLASIAELERTRATLRAQARHRLGVGSDEDVEPVRDVLRAHRLSLYPLGALSLLFVADQFQSYAFTVLTPDISASLGISISAIAAAITVQALAIAVAPLPVAAIARRGRRAMICIITGIVWSLLTAVTGFVVSLTGLVVVLALNGLTTGSVTALHSPLVVDTYPPGIRVRMLTLYNAVGTLGLVASPLLVGLLAGPVGLTWRGVFLCLGAASLAMSLFALALQDPETGRWDTEQVRAVVRQSHAEQANVVIQDEVTPSFSESCRRVMLIPTNRRVFAGFAMFGVLTVPLGTFISFFLDERWNFGPSARGLFFAMYAACGVLGLALAGGRGERQFRDSPAKVLRASGLMLGLAVTLIATAGVMPYLVPMLVCVGVAGAAIAVMNPLLAAALLSVVPAQMRPHAQGMAGIFMALGGLLGALLLGGVQDQFGIAGTLVAIAIPGVIGAGVVASAASLIERDLDRMVDEVVEEEELRQMVAAGTRFPMLACRGVEFSYGQMQVLFGVDFSVDDGEMVALLGTNGAGKSTLLRVISGIGLPSAGSVRLHGHDVTYLDAERRVRLGITQVPGGRGVFGQLSVVENLRMYGYTIAGDPKAVDRAIETSFGCFPQLAERRNAQAATLSGGEQQMLALSKALILRPRLLLIDELTLGLAPVVVGQLLDLVRQINAEGTSVVLVEQSVNIALNLVERAYFMEKGEVRFDGPAGDLLERDDLLRAVFLSGPSEGTSP